MYKYLTHTHLYVYICIDVCVCAVMFLHIPVCRTRHVMCVGMNVNESNAVGVLIIVYNIRTNGKAKEFTVIGYLK